MADSPIGVSVLCPALVTTALGASATRRPERFGGPYQDDRTPAAALLGSDTALSPDRVGDRVVNAIRHSEFFIFTHSAPREWVSRRHQRIMAGFGTLGRYRRQETSA